MEGGATMVTITVSLFICESKMDFSNYEVHREDRERNFEK